MSSCTQITEVSAPSGRRRWVYGRLDPAREPEIKQLSWPASEDEFLFFMHSVFGQVFYPVREESSTLSIDRRITAAEYRAQGIL